MAERRNPPHWIALEKALKEHPGSFVRLFWNGSGHCFTVRVENDTGAWFPLTEDGHPLWAVGRPTAVQALDDVAKIAREASDSPEKTT